MDEESIVERWDHAQYCLKRAIEALAPLRSEDDPHDVIGCVIDMVSASNNIIKSVKEYRHGSKV